MSWFPAQNQTSTPESISSISAATTLAPQRGTTSRYSNQKSQISPRRYRALALSRGIDRRKAVNRASLSAGSPIFSPRWTSEAKYTSLRSGIGYDKTKIRTATTRQ